MELAVLAERLAWLVARVEPVGLGWGLCDGVCEGKHTASKQASKSIEEACVIGIGSATANVCMSWERKSSQMTWRPNCVDWVIRTSGQSHSHQCDKQHKGDLHGWR